MFLAKGLTGQRVACIADVERLTFGLKASFEVLPFDRGADAD